MGWMGERASLWQMALPGARLKVGTDTPDFQGMELHVP